MDSGGPKEDVFGGGEHWRNLANRTEPFVCGDDVAFLSNYFDHLFIHIAESWYTMMGAS